MLLPRNRDWEAHGKHVEGIGLSGPSPPMVVYTGLGPPAAGWGVSPVGVVHLPVSQRLGSSVDRLSVNCRYGEYDESRRTKCRENVAHCTNSSRPLLTPPRDLTTVAEHRVALPRRSRRRGAW